MGNNNKESKQSNIFDLHPETKQGILGVVLLVVGLVGWLSFFALAGAVGFYIDLILGILFGWLKFLFPTLVLILGYILLRPKSYTINKMNYFGLVFLILSLTGLVHLVFPLAEGFDQAGNGRGGGIIGLVFYYPLLRFTSLSAALIILFAGLLIAILITFNTTFERLAQHSKIITKILNWILLPFKKMFGLLVLNRKLKLTQEQYNNDNDNNESAENVGAEDSSETAETEERKVSFIKSFVRGGRKVKTVAEPNESELIPLPVLTAVSRPKIDIPFDLLSGKVSSPTVENIELIKDRISKTLKNFGIEVEMKEVNVGPTVTQYTFSPAEGIKLNRITALNNDLSLALAAHPIRIEAPIPGRSLVGIEVPNKSAAIVTLREVLESKEFQQRKSNLAIGLGKDVKGQVWLGSLDKMPHLLIAGATGSGKSVCINSIIVSLLYQNGPDDLKFIMVDPKRVELKCYDGISHLITPVITDVKKTINALRWCLTEMDRRFELLSACGHRNIGSYNLAIEKKLPYIVFVIDELADLMSVAAADVEAAIIRLSQMARAVGIHLILATQRPSVDVITGLIKANITSRIAFSVPSLMDSRTILDTAGAEKLIGKGDMLFMSAEFFKPKRLQSAFVSDEDINKVVNYLKEQGAPEYSAEVTEKIISGTASNFEDGNNSDDELFEEAKEVVIRAKKASASLLQRRLKVGYSRAARLLDLMEEKGIIGPSQGAKPRELLVGEESLSISQSYGSMVDNSDEDFFEGDELKDQDSEFGAEDKHL